MKRSILDNAETRKIYQKAAELRRYTESQLKRDGVDAKTIAEIIGNVDWLKEARDLV